MSKVTIDPHLEKSLAGALGPVQVFNSEGVAIGYFLPSSMSLASQLPSWELSAEELARRKGEGSFISTAELLARLEPN